MALAVNAAGRIKTLWPHPSGPQPHGQQEILRKIANYRNPHFHHSQLFRFVREFADLICNFCKWRRLNGLATLYQGKLGDGHGCRG